MNSEQNQQTPTKKGVMQRIMTMWSSGKTGKGVLLIGGFIVLCLSCSVITTIFPGAANTPAEPTTDLNAIQTTVLETIYAEQTALAPTGTPEPTSTPEPTATQVVVDEYRTELVSRFSAYQTAFLQFNDQVQIAATTPAIILDDDWKLKTGLALGFLDIAATDLENIPGTKPEYEALDGWMKKIGAETHLLVFNYSKGIDNIDPELLNLSVQNMQNVTSYMNNAILELNKLNQ